MEDKPALSIVIPAYNEENYLGPCLAAILREIERTEARVEVLVVDNASTDDTPLIAQAHAGVMVVREPEKGLTRARQRGLISTSAPLVAYVDADTRMPEGWIAAALAAFKNDPKLVCLSGPYHYHDATLSTRVSNWLYWRVLAYPAYLTLGYMATGANFVIHRDTMESIGGFDTSIAFYGEDTNIARRLHARGKVLFKLSFIMPTSARRLAHEGTLATGYHYVLNFLSMAFLGRPLTHEYKDIR
jgi:glycosyltransferase involved in cell wall biosynthesis